MPATRFSRVNIPRVGRNNTSGDVITALAGLDMVSPVDMLEPGRTPDAHDFRLYNETSGGRQVAVSTRKGSGFYTTPMGEASNVSNTSVTGASTALVGVESGIHLQPFVPASDGRLTRLDLNVAIGNSTSPLRIDIYSDEAGSPSKLLSRSSISDLGETAEWKTARFINAIPVETGTTYWIVTYLQDDGIGFAQLTTTTDGTHSSSGAGILASSENTYSILFNIYTAPEAESLGGYRFNRENGDNKTLVPFGDTMYVVNENTGELDVLVTGLSADATRYSFANADGKVFWVNGYDDLKAWDGTTVETITESELPILSLICFHKDRLFGVDANDPNKIVYSENPGNPAYDATGTVPTPANEQWYYAWVSVYIAYAPRPKNGSPVTGILSFQDHLIILTQDSKYVLSGSDIGNFYLRQAVGNQGALSTRGITSDSNYIYFVSHDGIYRWNGSKDEKISKLIQPLFDKCPFKRQITLALWKSDLRCYMHSEFATEHDITAIFSNDFSEWMLDTDTYISRAIYYSDANDDMELIEFSSQTGTLYLAEQQFSSLGAPIDFDYRLRYDSRGVPGQRKKFKKYVPLIQAVGKSFPITYGVDKDFEDMPKEKEQQLNVGGAKIGEFTVDDGTILTGSTAFKPKKTSISGYSYYMQFRVMRNAVNNQVAFMGVQFTYKSKRL